MRRVQQVVHDLLSIDDGEVGVSECQRTARFCHDCARASAPRAASDVTRRAAPFPSASWPLHPVTGRHGPRGAKQAFGVFLTGRTPSANQLLLDRTMGRCHRRWQVPEISRFYGIVIGMFFREHGVPHFHAVYGSYEISVEVGSGRVRGKFPVRLKRLVLEWATLHESELRENWNRARAGLPVARIAPLE